MENAASSFAHRFEVECDSLDSGGAPLLAKLYPAPNFPSTPNAVRQWKSHPEWIDGYLCDLPRGPAPSAGETQFVYRQITAKGPVAVELEFAVRSPESDRRMESPNMEYWLRQTRYTCWLNGHLAVMEQVVHTTPRGGAMGVGNPFYVNRLVGLVPVEADGSAYFEVPALRSLYFHALDADGKMLMTMGSDI